MTDDLVVKLGRCRYLSLERGKWFCVLDPLSSNLWERGPSGVMHFNSSVFEKIPDINPMKNCFECFSFIEAEKFLPRLIRERKRERKRFLRLR